MGRGSVEEAEVTIVKRAAGSPAAPTPVTLPLLESVVLEAMRQTATAGSGWGTTVKSIAKEIFGAAASDDDRRKVQAALRSLRKKGLAESKDLSCPYLFWRPIETWTLEQVEIRHKLNRDGEPSYGAFLGDRLIGQMTLRALEEGRYTIRGIDVHPQFRRRGVATALLRSCEYPVEHEPDEDKITSAGKAWAAKNPLPATAQSAAA